MAEQERKQATYLSWDFRNGYVDPVQLHGPQNKGIYVGEDFVSSESILIATGSPTLAGQELARIRAVGVTQNFNLSQNKNIQQMFEIGSRDSIMIPGRTFIQASLARILFNGPSLMKALYEVIRPSVGNDVPITDYGQSPGSGELWMNLAATLFNKPIGVALIFHDSENEPYSGLYLEGCYMQAHNLSLAAGQTVVAENVALRVTKIKGISLTS